MPQVVQSLARFVAGLSVAVLVMGCDYQADPGSSSIPYEAEWPVRRVEGLTVEAANCVACHNGEVPSPWVFDASRIEAVSVRYIERKPGFLGNATIRFEQDGARASKVTAVSYDEESGPPLEESFVAELPSWSWESVSTAVARSGLFRFEGEAMFDYSSSLGGVIVTVERRGMGDCTLAYLNGDDGIHSSFPALVAHLKDVEESLDWR